MADDSAQLLLAAGVPLRLGAGRRHKALTAEVTRQLGMEDLIKMGTEEFGSKPEQIKELRQSHHTLARLLAQGVARQEVSAIVGMSISRISILQSDPTFAELLSYYEAMEHEQYTVARADMHERLAGLGFDAIEVLHDRLLEDPNSFDNKTLLATVEAMSDRTGHGKTSTVNTNVTHSLSSESIARLKGEVAAGREVAEEDRDALLCMAAELSSEFRDADFEEVGQPGVGLGLRAANGEAPEGAVPEEQPDLPPLD